MQKSDTEDKQLADSTAKTPDPQVRPWVRFWARMIDYGIFVIPACAVLLFALEFSVINLILLLMAAYLVFEAILLSLFGTTPGKALARIRLRREDGAKMNFSSALVRSFGVWWRGEGLGIPLVSLATNILAYNQLVKHGRTAWDRNGNIIVFHHPIRWWRISAMIILLTAIYGYGAVQFWPPLRSGVKILWNRNAAKYGDAEAQFELGKCYYIGVEKPEVSKDKWWLKAAEQPWSFPVQNNLWCVYKRYGKVTKNNAEAAKWFRKAAAQGYAKAEYMLGICYAEYYGPDFDYKVAKNWWLKAANQGYADAQYTLGTSYDCGFRKGESINMLKISNNMVERAKWYRKAAEQGHAEAQCGLGTCYLRGEGVAKDQIEAIKWYHKAAEQGNAEAQGQLGLCYTYALGVERNEDEAAKWFRKASRNGSQSAQDSLKELNKFIKLRYSAEKGDAKALFELGLCYNYGSGVNSNVSEALRLYRQAAERGYMDAQYILGERYYNGYYGFTKDKTEAVKWWRKAAAQGHENARKEIEEIDAYAHYLTAAEQGDAKAQFKLALCYEYGCGVEKNWDEAMKCFRKAAEQGDAEAQYKLGWCYGEGVGMTIDKAAAVKWYRKSAEQGYAEAQYQLANYYSRGYGVAEDKAEAVKWWRKAAEPKPEESIDGLQKAFRYYHEGREKSQYELAHCYASGDGVAKDEAEAARWRLKYDTYTKAKKNTP